VAELDYLVLEVWVVDDHVCEIGQRLGFGVEGVK
jgi:hypothetical protein